MEAAAFAIEGPFFAPTHRNEYYRILTERYNAARAEASRVAARQGISMKVEFFKPVHFNWLGAPVLGRYRLPTGVTQKTLESNAAFFPVGLINNDSCFDYIKWWEGAQTRYIGDWWVTPIFYFQEHQGAYKGNVKRYEFRAGETFSFEVHCTTSPEPTTVDAWLVAYCVLPTTQSETQITTT